MEDQPVARLLPAQNNNNKKKEEQAYIYASSGI
jgi:hypothetical protein